MLTLESIKQAVALVAEKYDVVKVDLFGSYASGLATEKSDADFLVEFNVKIPSIFKTMGFREELRIALNHQVDVVTLPLERLDKLSIDKVIPIYERT